MLDCVLWEFGASEKMAYSEYVEWRIHSYHRLGKMSVDTNRVEQLPVQHDQAKHWQLMLKFVTEQGGVATVREYTVSWCNPKRVLNGLVLPLGLPIWASVCNSGYFWSTSESDLSPDWTISLDGNSWCFSVNAAMHLGVEHIVGGGVCCSIT